MIIAACSNGINPIYWVVEAIRKHVIAEEALAGRCEGVGIEKSAQFWIVISALEVVERGLGIIQLATRVKTTSFSLSPGITRIPGLC